MNNITWLAGAPGRRDLRLLLVRQGMEAELKGWRLTGKAPPCFTIVKQYGLTWKRSVDKIHVYEAFCEGTAQTAQRYDRDGEGNAFVVGEGPRRIDRPAVKVSRARKRLEAQPAV